MAVKESSADPRRVTEIRLAVGDRFAIFAGVDDLILESSVVGIDGWVAGEPLLVLNADLHIRSANRSFYETFQVDPTETEGQFVYDLGDGQWDIPALRTLLEEIIPQNSTFDDFEVDHNFETIGPKTMLLNARRFPPKGSGT